ncbi:hypothetical protein Taro_018127 [Colocasia esculenta]|uniref:Preprotein translocase subunit SECE1 n=1 Tax=Colocasia esculenta TaxID=4460 RepID=A0A843UY62_COLES|nr:hypothetical protein [Colocasia esculenta]
MRMAAAAAMSSSLSFPALLPSSSPSASVPRQQQRSSRLLARRPPRVVLPASALRGNSRWLRDPAPPARASSAPGEGGDGGETPEGEDAAAAAAEAGGENAEAAESAEATARRILSEKGRGGAGGDLAWAGVAEEVREIEWPAFGKVVGTTGVVLAVIAGSSVALLTVNAVLAELSDRFFAGLGVQDFFSGG